MALPASLLNPILWLESSVHSIVLLAFGISLGLGFVPLMAVIIQLYWLPKQPIRDDDFSFPAPSVTEGTSDVDIQYDVFINHRGPDVKPTLASIITHRLRDNGRSVFLNRREIDTAEDVGRKIRNAINTAKVHIAIFSKTYADSSSCLNELCLMLETRATLIPVFFDVKPSDLRWPDGNSVYRDAFARRKNDGGHDPKKVEEWKRALAKVPDKFGLELGGPRINKNWGKLSETIVKEVNKVFEPKKRGRIGISAMAQRERSESILRPFVLRCDGILGGNHFSFWIDHNAR